MYTCIVYMYTVGSPYRYMFDFEFSTWGVYAYMGHIVLEEYYAQICNQNPQDPKCYVSGAAS